MDATVWSDYLCPWCYVGRASTTIIEGLGVHVSSMPYELHPEIPAEGRRIRADGRLAPVFDRIEEACEAAGFAFRRPTRMPNTRLALETAEAVRAQSEHAFAELDERLFRAHFVDGLPIDDGDLLDELVEASGGSAIEARASVATGAGGAAVDRSMAAARSEGITATPAWLIDGRFVIAGAQPPETITRWISRLKRASHDA